MPRFIVSRMAAAAAADGGGDHRTPAARARRRPRGGGGGESTGVGVGRHGDGACGRRTTPVLDAAARGGRTSRLVVPPTSCTTRSTSSSARSANSRSGTRSDRRRLPRRCAAEHRRRPCRRSSRTRRGRPSRGRRDGSSRTLDQRCPCASRPSSSPSGRRRRSTDPRRARRRAYVPSADAPAGAGAAKRRAPAAAPPRAVGRCGRRAACARRHVGGRDHHAEELSRSHGAAALGLRDRLSLAVAHVGDVDDFWMPQFQRRRLHGARRSSRPVGSARGGSRRSLLPIERPLCIRDHVLPFAGFLGGDGRLLIGRSPLGLRGGGAPEAREGARLDGRHDPSTRPARPSCGRRAPGAANTYPIWMSWRGGD